MPAGRRKSQTLPAKILLEKRMHFVHQDGQVVFKFATRKMSDLCQKLLERNGLTGADIDLFVPHQANLRIITYSCRADWTVPRQSRDQY